MNRLNDSTSLYLRQHGDNPVDWHPWDESALTLARESDKPILLSIGYSACHWCHVMAHESFEDEATAKVMNDLYINIKVDREERPDLDKVYQLSHQLLTQRGGGWPLTVFLDPEDLTPFFAGTYFPPAPRHGMPAFTELLNKLRDWFDANRDSVREQNQRLQDAISGLQKGRTQEGEPNASIFPEAHQQLVQRFDAHHGGFGGAPKFPQAPLLNLVQALSIMGEDFSGAAQKILHESLSKMSLSGLRDHLDGGFFRYTVDGSWTIPHFEKMLYDNALLLPLFAETAKRTGDPLLEKTSIGICNWLLQDMRHDNGGFFASMDADAGGVEGGFHVWSREELSALLSEEEYAQVAAHFGIDGPPNFEDQHWHLVRKKDQPYSRHIETALVKMHTARASRIPPATDTKQLTAWNAMCIDGLARAGSVLQREDWIDAAVEAMAFIKSTLWKDGMLFAVHANEQTKFPAYLDDYAFLIKACLSLLRSRWDAVHLQFAIALADVMIEKFSDSEHGGFFFSSKEQEMPIARLRPLQDDATPGGNGIAAQALEALGHLTADQRYLHAAGGVLSGSHFELQQHPLAHATLLVALSGHLEPAAQVIITGPDAHEMETWKAVISGRDRVNCYVLGSKPGDRDGLPGLYAGGDQTLAYVCEGLRCLSPALSLDNLQDQLNSLE